MSSSLVWKMGILISCQSISKYYSSRPLFRDLSFGVEEKERLGLIGPNGAGKSTLLKVLAGQVEPDEGSLAMRKNLRVAYVPQDENFADEQSIREIVTAAAMSVPFIDHEREAAIDSTLTKIGFPDREVPAGKLSGGWKKRLALACGLVTKPDLLLIDEPTNHLDLEGVLWLEGFLKSYDASFILISHDRAFIESVVTRVMELNPRYPEGFLSVKGVYSDFLAAREEKLAEQMNLQAALASQVRREIAWLQRGARARQTKAKGRIQEAEKLIDELAEVKRRNQLNTEMGVSFDASGRQTKVMLSAKGIAKSFGDKKLFSGLDITLGPGSRLGLVGRNGSGKTTLLNILIGKGSPDVGQVKRADDLKIVWFDQTRAQLDKTKSLKDALSPTGDSVTYRGRLIHIATWAKRFLFQVDQLQMPISYLSGGEQARILIANLMLQPADILILDEPTNDLDIPSLEVLEDSLSDFPGAIVLVTHDRMMLDTVSNRVLGLDGRGKAAYFADYEQWIQHSSREDAALQSVTGSSGTAVDKTADKNSGRRRQGLSTSEKRDLEAIPERIEEQEKLIAAIAAKMSDPAVSANFTRLQEIMKEQEQAQSELERLFSRWEDLEARAAADAK